VPLVRSELVRFAPEQQESRRADALRKALDKYIDRDLLLEEALTRGLGTDTRAVERSYDEARRDYPRDEDWVAFLKAEGLDPERFRGEIRSQHLVAALLADELRKHPVTEDEMMTAYNLSPEAFWERARVRETFETARGRVKQALERQRLQIIQRALVEELRARARIEILV
jgi:hypothetical protein